jgi:hypothetical protein
VVFFEVSDTIAFTNAYPIIGTTNTGTANVNVNNTFLNLNFLALAGVPLQSMTFDVSGWAAFRIRLNNVITGTGTVNFTIAASSIPISHVGTIIRSQGVSGALADNLVNAVVIPDISNTSTPLVVADMVYGGAFSGTTDAVRRGWNKMRASTVFRTASIAATATGNTAVWTPGSGNKFRILTCQITAQGLAATASGVVTVSFQDNVTGITFLTYDVDVPAVASVTSGVDQISGFVQLGSFGILSAAANNVLNFNISAAGAGTIGTYRVNVSGTEE